jgi:hypothetical protein
MCPLLVARQSNISYNEAGIFGRIYCLPAPVAEEQGALAQKQQNFLETAIL